MITNENILISIIVPVYNVENYLRKCLDSIVHQSYENLEIILINDGSTDSSGLICEEYKKEDRRITVVHQENAGQSSARNLGINIATGEYIAFIDSDDFIKETMYEKLLQVMTETNADIVECIARDIFADRELTEPETLLWRTYSGEEALKKHLKNNDEQNNGPRIAVWSRLYKRKTIGDIRFPTGKIHEDYYFTYRTLLNSKIYCYYEEEMYSHIHTNVNSTTKKPFSLKDFDRLSVLKERSNYLKEQGYEELYRISQRNYYPTLLAHYYIAKVNNFSNCRGIYLELKINRKAILSVVDKKEKFKFYTFYLSPSLYIWLKSRST